MITEQITIKKITADEGMILTDGKTYGKIIFLGAERTADEFYEIAEEEYEATLKEQEDMITEDGGK